MELWQNKSLGEYGSGWEWDSTWPKLFDYEKQYVYADELNHTVVRYYPVKYANTSGTTKPVINGTWADYGTTTSKEDTINCQIETTNGELLNSNSILSNNISCKPHSYNAGNYYNLPSQLGDAKSNSVCPLGWRLPENDSNTSYSNLLLAYGIDFSAGDKRVSLYDAALLNLPLSYLRSGRYYSTGDLNYQGNNGRYRMSSLSLLFSSISLNPTYDTYAADGYSVRCVSR